MSSGRLLVATPQLEAPVFRRAVVLMLDHGEEGAFGVVLNHPLDTDVAEVLPSWASSATAPGVLFRGGPVSEESALAVGVLPGSPEPQGVHRVVGPFAVVDLEGDPAALASELLGLRVFAGYSGWSPGQLDGEIEEGSWMVVDAEARDAFTDRPQDLWADVLRRQGGELALLSTYPDDPAQN